MSSSDTRCHRFGRYWTTWGDALKEAGFEPNAWNPRIGNEEILRRYLALIRELGRIPVKGDLRLKRRTDPTFPSDKVFERFGGKAGLLSRLRDLCEGSEEFGDLLPLLPPARDTDSAEPKPTKGEAADGVVYLLKAGRYYKIGMTNAQGRRERELAIQLQELAKTIHVIRTDDPRGIEAYWHQRFSEKHVRGEWYDQSPVDIAAFKRRRFQ